MHKKQPLFNNKTFRVLFLFLLVFVQRNNAQQQKIDSLLTRLKQHSQNDTAKVKLLSELAFQYTNVFPDSTILLSNQAYILSSNLNYDYGKARALIYWGIGSFLTSNSELAIAQNKEALAICEKIHDRKGEGSVYNNLAIIYDDQGNYETALSYYQKSLKIRQEIQDKRGVASNFNNIGNTYLEMGNYEGALAYLFKGLLLREQNEDEEAVSNSLSNIAGVYFHLGKYKEALDYNLRSLAIDEKSGNKQGIMSSLIIIGGVYLNQHENQKALEAYTKALKLSEEMENPQSIALCLMNIGEQYITQKKYAEAEKCFMRALTTWNENSDQSSIAMSYTNLGIIYLHTNRLQKSIEYLTKGYNLASQIGNKFNTLKASENLAIAYQKINDHKKANFYLQKHIAYKDSLFNEESTKKAEQIEFDFILGKKQNEIALLQKDKSIQNAKSEGQRILSLTLTLVSCLITVIAIVFYRSRQKEKASKELILTQKQEIEKQAHSLAELNLLKDKTFSVLSHDLRSPVASLSNVMMSMEQQVITPLEFDSLKHKLNRQLKAVSLLLDSLLQWSTSHIQGDHQSAKVTFNVKELASQNILLLKDMSFQKNIELALDIPDTLQLYANRGQMDIVIRNLLSNALKFTPTEGKITIRACAKDNHILLSIEDTGVGMSDEYTAKLFTNTPKESRYGTEGEKGTGIGILLCKEFVAKNNGTISVSSKIGEGTIFGISLPMAS
jgi:signal transduction histidine kinase/Tfp pilus assembly protein PilF